MFAVKQQGCLTKAGKKKTGRESSDGFDADFFLFYPLFQCYNKLKKYEEADEMKSYLIKDTTKQERIELIRQWVPADEAMEDCEIDLWDMYHDYIEGKREIAEINAAFVEGEQEENSTKENCYGNLYYGYNLQTQFSVLQ